ncbi:hypothetical protein [Kutzneria kofuensis]|uniref:hypothetical protein n=1 Tax=Kutzneria kofuensis TaxID=103725 RepID=UPI0031ED2091
MVLRHPVLRYCWDVRFSGPREPAQRREEDGVLGIPVMKLAVIGGVGVVAFA